MLFIVYDILFDRMSSIESHFMDVSQFSHQNVAGGYDWISN